MNKQNPGLDLIFGGERDGNMDIDMGRGIDLDLNVCI